MILRLEFGLECVIQFFLDEVRARRAQFFDFSLVKSVRPSRGDGLIPELSLGTNEGRQGVEQSA